MYGRWFLITFFGIGVVALLIALTVLASPLIAVAIAAVAVVIFLVLAGLGRARQGTMTRDEGDLPRQETKRGGAPVSGEGGS